MPKGVVVDVITGAVIEVEIAPPSLDEAKASQLAAVAGQYEVRIALGFPVTLEGGAETLQYRNSEDRTNWLALLDACREAVADGAGDAPIQPPLRCTSNNEYALTHAETIPLLKGMRAWAGDMLKNRWALNDRIRAADTVEALGAIDVTAGWPG